MIDALWTPRFPSPIAIGLCLAILPAIAVPALCTPYYQTNDDIGIDAALQGTIFFASPPISTHVHPWFATCVRALYEAFPGWPCYRFACTCIHVAATAALMARLLSLGASLTRGIAALAFVVIFDAGAHLFPQFTLTACHAAGIGAVIAAHTALWPSPTRLGDVGWWAVAFALGLSGAAVRFDAILFAALAVFPVVAVEVAVGIFSPRRDAVRAGKPLARLAVVPIGLAIVWMTLWAGARIHEPGGADRERMGRFHHARVAILDYGRRPDAAAMPATLERIGWSVNDFKLLLAWCFADETVFTTERLERFAAAAMPPSHNLLQAGATVRGFLMHPHFRILVMFVALALLGARDSRDVLVGTIPSIATLVMATTMFLLLRLPDRVLVPMISTPCAWILLSGSDPAAERWRGRFAWAWIVVAAVATAAMLLHAAGISRRLDAENPPAVAMMDRLNRDPSKKVFVIAAAFPFEAIPAWEPLSRHPWRILWLASDGAHSPDIKAQMRSMGVGDPMRAIATDPNVVTVASDGLQYGLAIWAREHYGLDVRFHEVAVGPFPFRNTATLLLALDTTPSKE